MAKLTSARQCLKPGSNQKSANDSMASKQQNRATTYLCPLGCGYEADSPGSVEGHVSAMQDDTHSGHWGSEYRDEIESGSVATDTDVPSIGPPDDSDGGSGGGSGGDSDPATPIDYDGRLGEDDRDDSAHMPGLPITPVVKVAVVIAVIVTVLYLVRSGSEPAPTQENEEESDESDALDVMNQQTKRSGGLT